MNLIPPIEMSDAAMREAHPAMAPKTLMVYVGEAVYVRNGSAWVLLDAEKHGHLSRRREESQLDRVDEEARHDWYNNAPEPEPPPGPDEL